MEEEKKEARASLVGSRKSHLRHLIYIYDRSRGIVAAEVRELISVRTRNSGGGAVRRASGREEFEAQTD